ncbi:UDP-N-acetylmuramoyl-tripeptide--D-alanyl-D-alanine ligase [Picosynechococcus sp. PCC 7003]|uniref:UDP-N-acetylmuramoyl-tripeptide--D-alanyl-D- alanine ligase n=1 Tax=Picosynechococcus sp. PCC 7003 TaxID=374981 RepID=UPI0008107A81|nr:UDP-N-acetylmuramoyl-tripeptide--D-alanyl-D-alanine ligase [Picosynechococcus sp. PCC 7003]ANV85342.1 UDP-N-acetylmuramoyl-tripeptide--D-alanyl-D-alanine ligase [Picosynechococcus sp. PCC 7003]
MGIVLMLSQLTAILGENLRRSPQQLPPESATGVSTDTRDLQPGNVFVALVGEKFDGHDYVEQAHQAGAIALITSRPLETDLPQWIVNDTLRAYQDLGAWWRQQVNIPVIGITGSVGKTSTKELIAGVLGTQGNVLKTEANFNNEIGVPKTLLNLTPDHDFAVIEMAMRGPGEIARLAEIAQPTIGIITNVGTAHIGRLGSREAIAKAKCELLEFMPKDSVAILNADNELLMATAATVWSGETLSYGFSQGDLNGEYVAPDQVKVTDQVFPVPLAGQHNALNYLAALGVMQVLGFGWQGLTTEISLAMPKGRSQRIVLPNDIVLLDETYNAGLESMLAALDLLKQTPGDRHIAVLGTMKELGEFSEALHIQVGEKAQALGLDQLYVLVDDPEAQAITQGAPEVPSFCFSDHGSLIAHLQENMQPGDHLLFKASNSVGLSRVVEALQQSAGS